jgi:hypothetical protein
MISLVFNSHENWIYKNPDPVSVCNEMRGYKVFNTTILKITQFTRSHCEEEANFKRNGSFSQKKCHKFCRN